MKKLTKKLTLVLVSVLVVMLCVGIMFACEPQNQDPDHTHSYSEDWKSDKDNHWKECSCGDKSEVAAHASNDGDEICDICGYNMHVHSYSNDWSKDATNHWHECSCGAKSDEAAHIDAIDADGNDGKDEICDICGYDMHEHKCVWLNDSTGHWQKCIGCNEEFTKSNHVDEKDADGNAGQDEICDICGYNMHVHDYASAWSKDATSHWHECACGAKSDEAAHIDAKDADGNDGHDGKCDACGWDGSFTVTVKDSKGNGIKDVELEINEVVVKTDENGIATFNMFVPDDELIYFNEYPSNYYKNGTYSTELGTNSYEITLISEITNTFAVVDYSSGEPISNVTLKLMDGETVVASGTTDSEGKVTLTYAPGHDGKYKYAIDDLASDKYLSNGAGVTMGYTSENPIPINVLTYAKYTITVKCDEGVEHSVEGLTVTVGSYTGTTNASGIAEVLAPASSSLYTVSVSGLEECYEAEDGKVGYDWWEMTTTYETTLTIKAKSEGGDEGGGSGTDTPSGGDEGETFAFPTELIGTWYTSYGEEVVITKDSASIDGCSCSNYSISTSNGKTNYIFTCRYSSYGIYKDGDDWYFGDAYNGNVYAAKKLSDKAPAIPDDYKGTWTGTDDNGQTITVVIGDTSIDLNGREVSLAYSDFIIQQDDDGNYSIIDANEYWSLIINDGKLEYEYTTYDDENGYVSGSATLTKQASGESTDTPVESDIFPEGLQGKWYTSLGKVLEIGANSITFDGNKVSNIAANDNDGTTVYSFSAGMGSSYSLYQIGADWYLDDNWNPAEKLSQTKPVFLDAIPEAFYGTWTGVLEDEYGDMEYSYSISADGISDGYYTSTIEKGDIIVMSETKIYMSGGSYLILNSDKISLDVYGDGSCVVNLSKKAA